MNEKIYTITLDDGTRIENLHLNGNNFISREKLAPSDFDGKLSKIIINDGETDEVYTNMTLVQVTKMGNEYWFVLRKIPEREIKEAKLRADLDYLAMMTNVEF